jgi:hypothetical protein
MEDYRKIKVDGQMVGIIGLGKVLAEMKELCAHESDERIGFLMREKLSNQNYIIRGSERQYEYAFLCEYKKFIGQPLPATTPERCLTVRVLGQGCPVCRRLSKEILQVASENNIVCDFEHVTDIQEIAGYGVFSTPALLINNQVKAVGSVPPKSKLLSWLREASQ